MSLQSGLLYRSSLESILTIWEENYRNCEMPSKAISKHGNLGGGNSNIFGIFTPNLGEDFHPF